MKNFKVFARLATLSLGLTIGLSACGDQVAEETSETLAKATKAQVTLNCKKPSLNQSQRDACNRVVAIRTAEANKAKTQPKAGGKVPVVKKPPQVVSKTSVAVNRRIQQERFNQGLTQWVFKTANFKCNEVDQSNLTCSNLSNKWKPYNGNNYVCVHHPSPLINLLCIKKVG